MRSRRSSTSIFISILFFPAGIGLLIKILGAATLAEKLLALALALFCPELARMACVDLENIEAVNQQYLTQSTENLRTGVLQAGHLQTKDSRLSHFFLIAASTVVLEATGFYVALISLAWGAITIIVSQLWFNLLARIQLRPSETLVIAPFGIVERRAVLIANTLGLGLISLWPMSLTRIWIASGLLGLSIVFLVVKYVIPDSQSKQSEDGRK